MHDPMSPQRSRGIINHELAVEIYQCKLSLAITSSDALVRNQHGCSKMRGESVKIARKLRISVKAVRDIWKHKTWVNATRHMWLANSDTSYVQVTFTTASGE